MREHVYVRVYGSLRVFSSARSVVAFEITPITDYNELTFHFLDVISNHLRNTQGSPGQVKAEQKQAQVNNNNFNNSNSFANPNEAQGSGGGENGFSAIQQRVLSIFSRDTSDTGCSITQVAQELAGTNLMDIRRAVDFLTEEGHLYSTIDDDHFKATNSA